MTRNATVALIAIALLSACARGRTVSGVGMFGEESGPSVEVHGEGDCIFEVRNMSTRPLELRYYSGVRSPTKDWQFWPLLGAADLEPRQTRRARVPCGDRRVLVYGYNRRATAGENRLAQAEAWVEEGKVTVLYLSQGNG